MDESGGERHPGFDARLLDRTVEGCAASHQALLAGADALLESGGVGAPSLLPGWSRAHVLAHLARNADSFVHAFETASRGEIASRYPGGAAQRERDIELGATGDPERIVADLRLAVYRLEGAWARADAATWSGATRNNHGAIERISDTVFLRWREVVVHHVDLGTDHSRANWPALWVRLELERQMMKWRATRPMGMGSLPPQVRELDDVDKVAWFLGRLSVDGAPGGDGG